MVERFQVPEKHRGQDGGVRQETRGKRISTCFGKPRAATGPTLEVFVWGQKAGRGSFCERF